MNPDKPKESKIPGSDDVCIPDNVPHNYGSHSATSASGSKKKPPSTFFHLPWDWYLWHPVCCSQTTRNSASRAYDTPEPHTPTGRRAVYPLPTRQVLPVPLPPISIASSQSPASRFPNYFRYFPVRYTPVPDFLLRFLSSPLSENVPSLPEQPKPQNYLLPLGTLVSSPSRPQPAPHFLIKQICPINIHEHTLASASVPHPTESPPCFLYSLLLDSWHGENPNSLANIAALPYRLPINQKIKNPSLTTGSDSPDAHTSRLPPTAQSE